MVGSNSRIFIVDIYRWSIYNIYRPSIYERSYVDEYIQKSNHRKHGDAYIEVT